VSSSSIGRDRDEGIMLLPQQVEKACDKNKVIANKNLNCITEILCDKHYFQRYTILYILLEQKVKFLNSSKTKIKRICSRSSSFIAISRHYFNANNSI